jgi:hypothetical protein
MGQRAGEKGDGTLAGDAWHAMFHPATDPEATPSALLGRFDHEAADELLHVGATTGGTLDLPRLPIAHGEGERESGVATLAFKLVAWHGLSLLTSSHEKPLDPSFSRR